MLVWATLVCSGVDVNMLSGNQFVQGLEDFFFSFSKALSEDECRYLGGFSRLGIGE